MRPEKSPSGIPIYVALADRLADALNDFEPGTRLPSEHELAAREEVSRDTARAALQELERRHLVRRSHGMGTFVSPRIVFRVGPDTPPSWTAMVREAGFTPRTEVIELVCLDEPDAKLREILELPAGASVLRRTTRGYVNEMVASVIENYIPANLAPRLDEQLSMGGSFYSLCLSLGYKPRRDWSVTQFEVVDHRIAQLLDLVGRPPTAHGETRLSDTKSGRPLVYALGWNRPDIIHVRMEEHYRGLRPSSEEQGS